jgi:hypothetical protein
MCLCSAHITVLHTHLLHINPFEIVWFLNFPLCFLSFVLFNVISYILTWHNALIHRICTILFCILLNLFLKIHKHKVVHIWSSIWCFNVYIHWQLIMQNIFISSNIILSNHFFMAKTFKIIYISSVLKLLSAFHLVKTSHMY